MFKLRDVRVPTVGTTMAVFRAILTYRTCSVLYVPLSPRPALHVFPMVCCIFIVELSFNLLLPWNKFDLKWHCDGENWIAVSRTKHTPRYEKLASISLRKCWALKKLWDSIYSVEWYHLDSNDVILVSNTQHLVYNYPTSGVQTCVTRFECYCEHQGGTRDLTLVLPKLTQLALACITPLHACAK